MALLSILLFLQKIIWNLSQTVTKDQTWNPLMEKEQGNMTQMTPFYKAIQQVNTVSSSYITCPGGRSVRPSRS